MSKTSATPQTGIPPRPVGYAAPVEGENELDLQTAPRILARVLGLALRYRGRFILATLTSLGATIFNIAIPRLLGVAVDRADALLRQGPVQAEAALQALTLSGGLLIGAAALRGLLQMVSGFQSEYIGQSVGRDLRLAFFEKLQRIGFDYHDKVHSGDLITRGMLDLEGVRGFIENGLQRLLTLTLLVVVGAVLMGLQDPTLALLTLSFVPVVGWRAARMGLRLRRAWTRLQERLSVLSRVMEESLQGARVVRAFAAGGFELTKFDAAADEALALSNERIRIRSGSMAGIYSGYLLAMVLVLWVGGHRVLAGTLTIGQLTGFLTFMTLLQLPVRQIGMIVNSSARAVSSGRRLFEVLDLIPTIRNVAGAKPLALTEGVLRFESVGFAYGENAPLVLDDISFRLERGRVLGIVGASGAGKTSVARLIPRFYDVTAGRITLDGQDIREVTLDSLRHAVSLVQQDVFLFDDSVESNVAYADPEAEEPVLFEATALAHMHDHVASLPLGYRTRVGERGVALSGGQRQRLSIARGMVPDPAIVIFDDATSAVDAATEHRVRAALRRATSRQATIIISHRIGSLMHADEILVLDEGRIVERGNHTQLIAAAGRYATLYQAQSRAEPLPQPERQAVA